ncbi:unnamed protein product [Closterium sp. NIES-54]
MAAQELRWLTYLLTDLGEQPRSPPVLYVDNKAMLALCREHRLEHRTKHIALRYFLARELQQRGQLRLAYVASEANTADIFTKALPPGDHQRFCTMLGFPTCTQHSVSSFIPVSSQPGGAEPEGVEPGGAESEGAESGGAESGGAELGQLREWLVRHARLHSGAPGAGGARDAGAGGAGVSAGAGGTGAAGPGGARTRGSCASGAGAGGVGAGGAGVGGTGAGGTGGARAGAIDPGDGGTVRLRPYFVPLLQQVLGVPSSTGLTPLLLCPLPDQSQPPLPPASPLPAPSP